MIFASELSFWIRDIGGGSLFDALLRLFDQGALRMNKNVLGRGTKKHGNIEVTNPSLSILGCTTPAFLSKDFKTDAAAKGLASRFIFVVCYKNDRIIGHPENMDQRLKQEIITKPSTIPDPTILIHISKVPMQINRIITQYLITQSLIQTTSKISTKNR